MSGGAGATRVLRKLRTLSQLFGWPVTCLYLTHRALQRLGGARSGLIVYGLYAQPIGGSTWREVRDDPGTRVERVDDGHWLASTFPRPATINSGRWLDGAICYAAAVKSEFAGHIWISRQRHDEDEVRCRYEFVAPEISAWDFDVYVEPRFRLGRALARMWKAVDADLARQGVQWSFSRISLFNPASVGAHRRLGAVCVGHAVFLVVAGMQLAWLPRLPYLHLSTSNRQRPCIKLRPPPRVRSAGASDH